LRFRAETGRDGGAGMAKGDPEDLAAQAAKRAEFRLHHVGTKLNERELRELDGPIHQPGPKRASVCQSGKSAKPQPVFLCGEQPAHIG
jgi:hypothetical protein